MSFETTPGAGLGYVLLDVVPDYQAGNADGSGYLELLWPVVDIGQAWFVDRFTFRTNSAATPTALSVLSLPPGATLQGSAGNTTADWPYAQDANSGFTIVSSDEIAPVYITTQGRLAVTAEGLTAAAYCVATIQYRKVSEFNAIGDERTPGITDHRWPVYGPWGQPIGAR